MAATPAEREASTRRSLWIVRCSNVGSSCTVVEIVLNSDETEIVVHADSLDAPVLLLVPHKWHLESKTPVMVDEIAPKSPLQPPMEQSDCADGKVDLSGNSSELENVTIVCETEKRAREVLQRWQKRDTDHLL